MASEGGSEGGSKAVLKVPVDSSEFDAFLEKVHTYHQTLEELPEAWRESSKGIKQVKNAFDDVEKTFGNLVQSVENPKLGKSFELITKSSKETEKNWRDVAKTMETTAKNMSGLLRDGGKFSGMLGLLGLGGVAVGASTLFGAVRGADTSLADQNIMNRKLGLKPGEEQAFSNVYEKAGGDDAMLHKVANAQAHQDQWKAFMALGIMPDQITGMDPAHLAAEVLRRGGEQFNQKGASAGLWADSTGVSSLMDVNSMRLAGSYQNQFGDMGKQYEQLVPKMAVLQKQLDEATAAHQKIEAALAQDSLELDKALIKLNPLVIDAANGITKWVTAFAESKELEDDIKGIVSAFEDLEKASNWLTDKLNHLFGPGSKDSGLGTITGGNIAPDFHVDADHPLGTVTRNPSGKSPNFIADWWDNLTQKGNADAHGSSGGSTNNNPGNLEVSGKHGQFQQFASPEQGVLAMDRQLQLYAVRDHLNTLGAIIGKYSPAKDGNNVPAYIRDVASRTGFDPSTPLDMSDPKVRAAVEAAMIRHENGKRYSQFDQQRINDLLTGKAVPDGTGDSAFTDPKAVKKAKADDRLNNPQIVPFTDADQRAKDADAKTVVTESVMDRLTRAAGMLRDAVKDGGGSQFRMPDTPRPANSTQQAPFHLDVKITNATGSSVNVTTSTLAQ